MAASRPKTQTSHYVGTTKHFTGNRRQVESESELFQGETRGNVATAPYGKTRTTRTVGKQTHRGFQTAKLNRITTLLPPPPPRLNPAENTIPLIPQSVVGNWLLITSVPFNDQFPRSQKPVEEVESPFIPIVSIRRLRHFLPTKFVVTIVVAPTKQETNYFNRYSLYSTMIIMT